MISYIDCQFVPGNMHPSIKLMFEKSEIIYENENKVQVLNFLDVKKILHEDNSTETDIYYKPTNTHMLTIQLCILWSYQKQYLLQPS